LPVCKAIKAVRDLTLKFTCVTISVDVGSPFRELSLGAAQAGPEFI
jgi:hypothetical protein